MWTAHAPWRVDEIVHIVKKNHHCLQPNSSERVVVNLSAGFLVVPCILSLLLIIPIALAVPDGPVHDHVYVIYVNFPALVRTYQKNDSNPHKT
jgi:hypothetical protein